MRWNSKIPEADSARWARTRAKGKWWYVALNAIGFGLGISIFQLIADMAANLIDFSPSLIVINLGIGFFFGFLGWSVNESRYREAIEKREVS
ncbi:MAG: hypothetical protein AB7V18_16010 [Pyrinomonadaceae bacterium]